MFPSCVLITVCFAHVILSNEVSQPQQPQSAATSEAERLELEKLQQLKRERERREQIDLQAERELEEVANRREHLKNQQDDKPQLFPPNVAVRSSNPTEPQTTSNVASKPQLVPPNVAVRSSNPSGSQATSKLASVPKGSNTLASATGFGTNLEQPKVGQSQSNRPGTFVAQRSHNGPSQHANEQNIKTPAVMQLDHQAIKVNNRQMGSRGESFDQRRQHLVPQNAQIPNMANGGVQMQLNSIKSDNQQGIISPAQVGQIQRQQPLNQRITH